MSAATQVREPTGNADDIVVIIGNTLGKVPQTLPAISTHNVEVWHNSLVPPSDCYLGFPAGVTAEAAAEVSREFSHAQICSMLLAVMSFNFTSRAAVSHGGMPEQDLPITELKV